MRTIIVRSGPPVMGALAAAILATSFARPVPYGVAAAPSSGARPAVPVGGRIDAGNACYVRLPDLPAGRYGGFGAYNAQTGVLAYAGGAEKLADDITMTHSDLYAIRLDGPTAAWQTIAYAADAGYARSTDHGCREMASVPLGATQWASVFGKDGCDNGRFSEGDDDGGDIKTLSLGARASRGQVRWLPNSGVEVLGDLLALEDGQLARPFAAFDTRRNRIVLGQGTFDSGSEQGTRDEVYAASRVGNKFSLKQLRPGAAARGPGRRYGACAAYVNQAGTGTDGILVVGGRLADTTFAEAWWLDFADGADGRWVDLARRFENFDVFGARYDAACGYDAASRTYYTWTGRIDNDIPDGASRSGGAWRVDLSRVDEPGAPLRWERLAPDDLDGFAGRHMVPSLWDAANRRMLVVGGRQKLETFGDVWAIYPDVTGQACDTLDPYAPFRADVPPPTPTQVARPTAAPPGPTVSPPSAPTEAPLVRRVCASIRGKVPPAVISRALADPYQVQGYAERQFPNLPPGPNNPRKLSLTLRNVGLAWDALFNPPIFKAGCS